MAPIRSAGALGSGAVAEQPRDESVAVELEQGPNRLRRAELMRPLHERLLLVARGGAAVLLGKESAQDLLLAPLLALLERFAQRRVELEHLGVARQQHR